MHSISVTSVPVRVFSSKMGEWEVQIGGTLVKAKWPTASQARAGSKTELARMALPYLAITRHPDDQSLATVHAIGTFRELEGLVGFELFGPVHRDALPPNVVGTVIAPKTVKG